MLVNEIRGNKYLVHEEITGLLYFPNLGGYFHPTTLSE